MLKAVITYLNLKLGLLNYFDLTRCLSELKVDSEGKTAPKEYISNGNWDNIDFDDKDGVSYWRLRDEITTSPIESVYKAGKRVEVTIPLRLVFSVPRRKLTEDDAYSFDRIRQTITKQFNIDDGDLKNTLGCEKVEISSPTANGDAKEVWDEETENTGTHEPNYSVVFGSVDIDVKLIYKGTCLPTECDDVDSDILHSFDFCSAAVRGRLTPTQLTCLEDALCGVCADATVENSDASYSTTVASGGSLVVPDTSISANGDLVANQPSTIAKDITVRYETLGTVPTTISGGEVVVPDVTPTTPLSYLGGKALSTDGVSDRAVGNVCGQQYYQNFGVGFMFNDPTSAVGSAKGLFGFGTSTGQNNYNSFNLWCFPNQTRWFLNMPDGQTTNYAINLSKDTDTHIYLQVGSSNVDVYLDGSLYGTFSRTTALPVGDLTLILGGAVYLQNPHAFKMWQVVVTDGSLDATAAAALSTAGHADTDPSGVSGVIEAFDFGRTATGVPSTDPANPTVINGIVRGSELYCNTTFTSPNGIVAL